MKTETPENAPAHTPGPWEVDAENGFVCARGNPMLADIGRFAGPHWQEGQANARLIAAAPELLAIVEMLGDWIDQGAESINFGALAANDETLKMAVNAALAKTKGGAA